MGAEARCGPLTTSPSSSWRPSRKVRARSASWWAKITLIKSAVKAFSTGVYHPLLRDVQPCRGGPGFCSGRPGGLSFLFVFSWVVCPAGEGLEIFKGTAAGEEGGCARFLERKMMMARMPSSQVVIAAVARDRLHGSDGRRGRKEGYEYTHRGWQKNREGKRKEGRKVCREGGLLIMDAGTCISPDGVIVENHSAVAGVANCCRWNWFTTAFLHFPVLLDLMLML